MTITERAAYIKGMMDGMNFKPDTDEKKLIAAMSELISDMAAEIESIKEDNQYLGEYVEELDEDLGNVEEYVYDDEDDEYYDNDENCEVECDCGNFIEICDDNIKDGKLVCPECDREFDLSDICDGCDGCCDCE